MGRDLNSLSIEMFSEAIVDLPSSGFVSPSSLSDEEQAELVRKIQAGEILKMHGKCVGYVNRSNANSIRPSPLLVNEIIETAGMARFLDGHRRDSRDTNHGHVISAEMNESGEVTFKFEVNTVEGMTDFVMRRFSQFSIGWASSGFQCKECYELHDSYGLALGEDGYGYEFPCGHVVDELWTTNNKLVELSFVTVGAVEGTRLLSGGSKRMNEDYKALTAKLAQAQASEKKLTAELSERDEKIAKLTAQLDEQRMKMADDLFERHVGSKFFPAQKEAMLSTERRSPGFIEKMVEVTPDINVVTELSAEPEPEPVSEPEGEEQNQGAAVPKSLSDIRKIAFREKS